MKKCPYCAEDIQDEAKKCKYCNEWLDKEEEKSSYKKQDKNNNKNEKIKYTHGVPLTNGKKTKVNYIRKHWRGELSLVVSFWINFLLLNIVLTSIPGLLAKTAITEDPLLAVRVIFISFIVVFCIVYPWQIIGLWRSCNNHIELTGKKLWARSAQVLLLLVSISLIGEANKVVTFYHSLFEKYEGEDYSLTLMNNNKIIHLSGGIGLGVSDEINDLLKSHKNIQGIVLDSNGGRAYEGRKLFNLIMRYGLDTYSFKGCNSACTSAFIAGKKRYLGPEANLGFHRPYIRNKKIVEILNSTEIHIAKEENKDTLIFKQQGVKDEFINKIFKTPYDDVWYPTFDEMKDNGVIHGVVNPYDIFPVE